MIDYDEMDLIQSTSNAPWRFMRYLTVFWYFEIAVILKREPMIESTNSSFKVFWNLENQ